MASIGRPSGNSASDHRSYSDVLGIVARLSWGHIAGASRLRCPARAARVSGAPPRLRQLIDA
eukprot:8957002-Pyramimonas_sp.AAC.1